MTLRSGIIQQGLWLCCLACGVLSLTAVALAWGAGGRPMAKGGKKSPRPVSAQRTCLIGCPAWNVSRWRTVDDRIRGGSSTSQMSPKVVTQGGRIISVAFNGLLDHRSLGGAGFASQQTMLDEGYLYSYRGLEVVLGNVSDDKWYSINVKYDDMRAGIDYKYLFQPSKIAMVPVVGGTTSESRIFRVGWSDFKLHRYGRELEDGNPFGIPIQPLHPSKIKILGFMCSSRFGLQEGPFELEISRVNVF